MMVFSRRQFIHGSVATGCALTLGLPLWASPAQTYTVSRGDTLGAIARRFDTTVEALRAANNLTGDRILVGQVLTIPTAATPEPPREHTVVRGDTLSGIASTYRVSVAGIMAANGLAHDRIFVGQRLIIPASGTSAGRSEPVYIRNVIEANRRITIERGRWDTIVVHHSGIDRGNATSYDRFHRENRRMVNGLAYHFVIGNGIDSGDGEIEIGNRWREQLLGGHVRNHQVNLTGIGICLVGNFEQRRPTHHQLAAAQELIDYLLTPAVAGRCRFTVHREVDRNHTVCPGRFFPTASFKRRYA
jgi:LysM repeat protein